ncbi:hypothetical protein HGH93_02210 [Chitinophaga polysaccharea]|uniref:hypothetical protein n=1 Tax=Chitinophaga TaxID=79328 RepID=UPI0014552D19|nr:MULTISPECIES: hypothetical protein [Chitinophaga]NLR56898.1 hypothetical protein [Chitinophaga polysaccharea]NLU93120.1 hypothetical protein [Chitinophaga sp. Ak27]
MKQRYETLTAIRYCHDFFRALSYEGISIRISPSTSKQLLDADLVLKQQPAGCTLLYNTLTAGKRNRTDLLQDNITLIFDLVLKDPLFYNYTAINAGDITKQYFVFGNDPGNAPAVLHKDSYAGVKDLQNGSAFFTKPFGQLVLQLNESLQASYDIRFPAKSTYWCYFLMSDHLAALANPVIIDNNGASCFSKPVLSTLPEKEQVPVLVSNQPIYLSDRITNQFRLANKSEDQTDRHNIIISPLPVPEINRISAAGRSWQTGDKVYSEIFLY